MKLKSLKEKRNLLIDDDKNLQTRALKDENGDRYIEGYAARFNHDSKLLVEYHQGKFQEFTERILPGAFDEALQSERLNVIHTIDHDRSKMVARTRSGTLQLSTDQVGLKYRFKVPNSTLGNDLFEMVSRGDYFESSFVFTLDEQGEKWEKRDGKLYRTISTVTGLYDTSTVVDGAYSSTPVAIARNLQEFEESEQNNRDDEKMKLENEIFILENSVL
jgi:HK97 family phage prohead protease